MREEKMIDEIQRELFALQDTTYRDFQAKLIPGLAEGSMIGVRTPELRKLARQMAKREEIGEFLEALPHTYFDENQLHAFILAERKNFAQCMDELTRFLPYVDNWATCDHFLDEDFDLSYPELVSKVRSEEYYINMMIAWYFATALAKQYEAVLPYIEESRLAPWTHNKTIQKAIESNRITAEQKAYLRGLKKVTKKA